MLRSESPRIFYFQLGPELSSTLSKINGTCPHSHQQKLIYRQTVAYRSREPIDDEPNSRSDNLAEG